MLNKATGRRRAGGAGGQFVPLYQHGIPTRLGEVIGDAVADGATANNEGFDMVFMGRDSNRRFATICARSGITRARGAIWQKKTT